MTNATSLETALPAHTRPRFRLWHVFIVILAFSAVLAVGRIDEPFAIPLAILVAVVEIAFGLWWIFHSFWIPAGFLGFCLLTACLFPTPRYAPEAARRMSCSSSMKNLVLALHNYHDVHKSFPPAYVTDASGKPLYSWRVLILPYLEQEPLYQQFHLDEPWDSPHNLTLVSQMPHLFRCPTANQQKGLVTPYVALVGPQSMWPEGQACARRDITDGTSNTIALIEWPESDIVWSEPRDLPADNLPLLTKPSKKTLRSKQRHGREGGVTVGLADGSVRFMEMPKLSPLTVRAVISRAGGETIKDEEWFP